MKKKKLNNESIDFILNEKFQIPQVFRETQSLLRRKDKFEREDVASPFHGSNVLDRAIKSDAAGQVDVDYGYDYIRNKEDKHICVSDCTKYNGTNNLEKNICEFSDDHKKKRGVDYMIWIFFALFGVLLIIIFYSICKTFIYQKKK